MILIDLDRFADFNAVTGQAVGNSVLVELARRLVLEVGSRGTVARIDGDEFAVLLTPCTAADVRELAQLALGAVRQPVKGCSVTLTASIGTAIAPEDAAVGWELLNLAAIAQFVAKSAGRDRQAAAKPLMRAQIEKSVREGIASGSFGLNYQPIVTLADPPQLVGLEAFLRWHHPTRGLIVPGNFLPVLEDARLARLLGEAALREAATQARKWLDARLAFGRISLNVSMHQLREGDLAREIQTIFAARAVPVTTLRATSILRPNSRRSLRRSRICGVSGSPFPPIRDRSICSIWRC